MNINPEAGILNIKKQLEKIEWLQNLAPRERNLVYTAAILSILLMLYLLIWRPVSMSVSNMEKQVQRLKKDNTTLLALQKEAKTYQLGGAGQSRRQPMSGSLLTVVERTRTAGGLDQPDRLDPNGNNSVQVEYKNVPFDKMITWLGNLQRKYGIEVSNMSTEKTASGLVKVRMVLQGPEK